MAYEQALKSISVPASADLSASQYCFMTIGTDGQLAVCGVDAAIAGVLQDKPAAAGRAGALGISGGSKLLCGGSVTMGDRLTSDSSGRAITIGSGDAWSGAIALETGSTGIVIAAILQIVGPERSSLA